MRVSTKSDLKEAVKNKEYQIVVTGSLARKMKFLATISRIKGLSYGMSIGALGASMAAAGPALTVALALIAVLGVVTIVAILNDYNVKWDYDNGVLILTRG